MAPSTCVWVATWASRTSPDTILVRRRRAARTSSSATTSFASSRVATAGWSRRASPTRRTPTSACSACSSRWSASGRSAVAPRIGTTSASTRSPGSGSGPPPRRRPGASVSVKGVVLAGGLGTRLLPLTRITNKHLLPVFDRPMIYYPLQTLINAGITDILLVTGGYHAGDFLRLLGNGREFGLAHLNYTYQEGEGGIAAALALAEHFADGQQLCVILGDNLIEGSIAPAVARFEGQGPGARIILKEVPDAERFGVAELGDGRVVSIEEKPSRPKSRYAVTGMYMYDARVFDVIRSLRPSGRGELEITDVNNWYLAQGELMCEILDGWWTDAGTMESLHRAGNLVAETGANKVDGPTTRPPDADGVQRPAGRSRASQAPA